MIYAGNTGMDAATLHSGIALRAAGAALAACLFFHPASAGDNTQVVPVYSGTGGNQAWVELETEGRRSTATPFVAVDEGGLRKLLENPDDNGSLAIPVPRLMRLVERARKAAARAEEHLRGQDPDIDFRLAEGGGPPLCVLDDFPYDSASHVMRAGETICLVTDGVTEAMNAAGELYGRARLEAALAGIPASATAAEIGEAVKVDVSRFTAGAEASDDVTILVLQWHGPGASGS